MSPEDPHLLLRVATPTEKNVSPHRSLKYHPNEEKLATYCFQKQMAYHTAEHIRLKALEKIEEMRIKNQNELYDFADPEVKKDLERELAFEEHLATAIKNKVSLLQEHKKICSNELELAQINQKEDNMQNMLFVSSSNVLILNFALNLHASIVHAHKIYQK